VRMRMGEESEMSANRVDVLCPGMIRRDGAIVLEARSTVTLVSIGTRHILVDTSAPQNRDVLLRALAERGLSPSDIDTVVLTHAHGDHDGNMDLFPNAMIVAHPLEGGGTTIEGRKELCERATLFHTPGHTPGSISLVVDAEEVYAIVGDAIPTIDNVRKWVPPGHHYDRQKAMLSMALMVEMADVIVPGHGGPFRAEEFKDKAR